MALVLTQKPGDKKTLEVVLVARYGGVHLNQEDGDALALKTNSGVVTDRNEIFKQVALQSHKYPLYGANDEDKAKIDTWLNFANKDICAHNVCDESLTPEAVYERVDLLKTTFDTLNKHLLTNFYIVTNRVTIADLAVVFSLYPLLTNVFDTGFRKGYPNVIRWFETVVNQPKFLDVFGPTTLAAKSSLPPVPKKQPAVKKVKKEDGGDDEPALEEAGKKLDIGYLGNLPASKFNLESWKTKYANTNPTRPDAIDFFWQNYDPEGWCIYLYKYKWPEECKIDFMTANKFGGFLQRAEAVKNLAKFSMTSQVTLKKDDLFHIWGIWLFRGTVVPPEFMDVDDTEYYDWSKVDVSVPEQREFVSDVWAWESQTNWGGRGEFYTARTWGC
jgi:elongation factor 1-gamma